MSYSGDAAEQVVRMTMEGSEVAIKLAGAGAKQLAILLYAILRDQKKTKGKIRLTNMLRSGKELKVFAVKDKDLQRFCMEAKKYGVLYCVLRDKNAKDGITDIMVRAEDASKINRIFERFDLATVDMGSVKSEIERSRSEKAAADTSAPEQAMPEQDQETLLDALLAAAPSQEEGQMQNPTEARTAESRQSEPTLKPNEPAAQGISEPLERSRPSVRQELKEIKAQQEEKAEAGKKAPSKPRQSAAHKAPRKKKSKKQKER